MEFLALLFDLLRQRLLQETSLSGRLLLLFKGADVDVFWAVAEDHLVTVGVDAEVGEAAGPHGCLYMVIDRASKI